MQLISLPLTLTLLGATVAPEPSQPANSEEPRSAMLELQPDFPSTERCRNRNLPAGDNPSRQPRLERGPATPEMGQVIYAVDRRVDGCSVVLVKSDLAQQLLERPFGRIQLSPEEIAEIKRGR